MRIYSLWFLAAFVAFAALAGTAQSTEAPTIADLYSNIESFDATVEGDASGNDLHLELISSGEVLQTRDLKLDGPGTWAGRWAPFEAESGTFDVCASLIRNRTVVSKRCCSFFYGGEVPVRFDVRDFYADSRGMHMAVAASDPTIVDIYYMLIKGNKAIYVTSERAVPIMGGFSTPLARDYAWKLILENGREYTGRVKIVEPNHNQTRAFMSSFLARDDAVITETYQDETGASATVVGNSRVPFEGMLRFTLSSNGTVRNITQKRTPVLLAGDDETVEISWNKTLEPGIYQLRTELLGKGGDVKDLEENVIEAKPIAGANTTGAVKKSPLPAGFAAAAMVAAALLRGRRKGPQEIESHQQGE